MNNKINKIKTQKVQQQPLQNQVSFRNLNFHKTFEEIENYLLQTDFQKYNILKELQSLENNEYPEHVKKMERIYLQCKLEQMQQIPSRQQWVNQQSYLQMLFEHSPDNKNIYKQELLDNSPFINNTSYQSQDKLQSECCQNDLELNEEQFYYCLECGKVYHQQLDLSLSTVNYSDIQDIINNIDIKPQYKTQSHFKEKIEQKLSLKRSKIPEVVLEKVKNQIACEKITDLSLLRLEDIRRILKKLGLEKYYEMEYSIFYKITGTQILQFSDSLISTLEDMFEKVNVSFKKLPNKGRNSMFVYNYTIHKLLEILNLDQYKSYFKPPKNPDKIIEYDVLWKQICLDLNWKYIPTTKF